MTDSPRTEAGLTETWSNRRLRVADKWGAIAPTFGSPASAFEIAGAVAADQRADLNGIPGDHAAYDRRALLNVIAVLLEDRCLDCDLNPGFCDVHDILLGDHAPETGHCSIEGVHQHSSYGPHER